MYFFAYVCPYVLFIINITSTSNLSRVSIRKTTCLCLIKSFLTIITYLVFLIKGYNFKENKLKSTQEQFDFYQPYIESMKFAFAQRGVLGDPDFLPDGDIEKVDLKFKVDN